MSDYEPVNAAGASPFTKTAGAVITGGNLVSVTADNTVSPTTANTQRAVGVAAHDAPSGGRVTCWPLPELIHESINNNAGTITAGMPITAGASAGVDTPTSLASGAAAGTLIGICTKGGLTAAKVQWVGV